jgi:lysophospholipase L1-like esterase
MLKLSNMRIGLKRWMLLGIVTYGLSCGCWLPLDATWAQDKRVVQSLEQATEVSFEVPEVDAGLPGAGPIRRYDWFRDLWRKRRSDWAQHTVRDQAALVFLGDSITQGWGDDLGGSFSEVKTANRGISGDTTRGMLIRLSQDVLALKPTGVVLLMGTNDLEEGADPATIVGNVELIIAALQAHDPNMPVILCQVFPSSSTKKRPAEKIQELNSLLAASVRGNAQITLVDTWTLFADAAGNAKVEEFPDLLHPNKAGYAKWSAALRPILATHGFLETTADDFKVEDGFESLFNGHDLTGWCLLPSTDKQIAQSKRLQASGSKSPSWPIIAERLELAGAARTPDGRYVALHDRLIVTTPTEGRRIQQLWTTREFPDDFTLKLEFRATPNADSGVFVREPQLQCRDYLLAGPYKDLKSYRAGQWNELVIQVRGGIAHCTCNGELLEAEFKVPATGPIGLEGDRGQIEYRRIRVGP